MSLFRVLAFERDVTAAGLFLSIIQTKFWSVKCCTRLEIKNETLPPIQSSWSAGTQSEETLKRLTHICWTSSRLTRARILVCWAVGCWNPDSMSDTNCPYNIVLFHGGILLWVPRVRVELAQPPALTINCSQLCARVLQQHLQYSWPTSSHAVCFQLLAKHTHTQLQTLCRPRSAWGEIWREMRWLFSLTF